MIVFHNGNITIPYPHYPIKTTQRMVRLILLLSAIRNKTLGHVKMSASYNNGIAVPYLDTSEPIPREGTELERHTPSPDEQQACTDAGYGREVARFSWRLDILYKHEKRMCGRPHLVPDT